MIEITILSGKGGTGKTSISAALASLTKDVIICDNDVDAADMHLLLHPTIKEEHKFICGWNMSIDTDICVGCNICVDKCRFDAIFKNKKGDIEINPFKCEACRLCEHLCPQGAIKSTPNTNNSWYVSDTRFGTLVHAKMGPGEENSGKLVTKVRKRAREIAISENLKYIINDGPPGIGCAAIASLTGCDIAIVVLEPSKSSLHDASRLIKLAKSFNIKTYAIINKYDINLEITDTIIDFLKKENIFLLSKLAFDKSMTEAMIEGLTITEYDNKSNISTNIKTIWSKIKNN